MALLPQNVPDFIYLLPEEVWEHILQFLYDDENTQEALLLCQWVDPVWKRLVDKLPPNFFWSHWSRVSSYPTRRHATTFQSRDDIEKFVAEWSQLHPDYKEKNPFPRRSVKIDMKNAEEKSNANANLDNRTPSLVPATGDAGEEELRVIIDKLQYRYRFTTVNQLQKFIDKMKPTLSSSISPFINKLLVFNFDNVEGEVQNIKELGVSFLTQFGHGISNFTIYNVQVFDLPSLLAHLPNLKVLTLRGNVELEFDENDVALWEAKVNLVCLELLNVEGLNETNTGALLNPLLRCCGEGLARLVCSDDLFYSPANLVKLQAGGFPNLRFLQVERLAYGFVNRRWQPELGATMPLEQIELIDNFGDFEDVTLNEILASIRIFEHTLSHLKLCLKLGGVGKKKINLLPFPRLTTFTTNLRFASTNCFPAFVRLQAEILTEMNFEVSCKYLPQEAFVWLMGLFQALPNLIKITAFCGYMWYDDTENAERVELERNGIVRRFKYVYKDQCYTNT